MNLIKNTLALVATLALSISAVAVDANTLKQNMKEIGRTFKQISTTATDASQNLTNAEAAGRLVILFSTVEKQMPDSISQMPASEQESALAEFHKLIGEEIDLAIQLKNNFITNDNSAAMDTLSLMAAIKKNGHSLFAD